MIVAPTHQKSMPRFLKNEKASGDTLESVISSLPRPSTVSGCIDELKLLAERQCIIANQLNKLMGRDETLGTHSYGVKGGKVSTISSLPSAASADILPSSSTIQVERISRESEEEQATSTESPEPENFLIEENNIKVLLREDTNIQTQMLAMNLNKDLGESDEIDYDEESAPLVVALKKLQQKNVKMSGIKKWTNNLADLFYITDVDGSGAIDPSEYRTMIEKLDISKSMKTALYDKFEEIDTDNDGSINLYEFLYFFLKFSKFQEEILFHAYNNAPYLHEKDLSPWQLLRLRVYLLIECPNHNIASRVLFCLDLMFSFIPIALLFLQAIRPDLKLDRGENTYIWLISIFFAIQYILGLATCRTTRLFIMDLTHTAELVSFIFWIGYNTVLTPGSMDPMGFVVFRILRIVKIHNVFNLEGLGENLAIYTDTLQLAWTSYGAVLGFLCMLILFFSLLFYAFERGHYYEEEGVWIRNFEEGESPFSNLFNCIYFTIVTFTTLGYGDFSPKSYIGKLVAVTAAVTGLVNLTFLINIIGDCFEEVFRVFVLKRSRKLEEERAKFLQKHIKRARELLKVRQRQRRRSCRIRSGVSEFYINRKGTAL